MARESFKTRLESLYDNYREASPAEENAWALEALTRLYGNKGLSWDARNRRAAGFLSKFNLNENERAYVSKLKQTCYSHIKRTSKTKKEVKNILDVAVGIRNLKSRDYKRGNEEYHQTQRDKEINWQIECKEKNLGTKCSGFRTEEDMLKMLKYDPRKTGERRKAKLAEERRFGKRLAAGAMAAGLVAGLFWYKIGAKDIFEGIGGKVRSFVADVKENVLYNPAETAEHKPIENAQRAIIPTTAKTDKPVVIVGFPGDLSSIEYEENSRIPYSLD